MSIATERAGLFAAGLQIITRERWGAVCSYTSPRTVTRPAQFLFLHVSVTRRSGDPARDMRTIERIGQERFGIGCSYNAAATTDGRLWEMQPLRRRGAHTVNDKADPRFPSGSLNHVARALVLPQMDSDPVTDAQIDAAARWAAACMKAGEVAPGAVWYGHRDVAWKSCPGDSGYRRLPELNRLTRQYVNDIPVQVAAATVTPEEEMFVMRRVEDGTIALGGPGLWRELNQEQSSVAHAFCRQSDAIPANARQYDVARDLCLGLDRADGAETARLVLAGLGDVVLSSEQVRSIIDAMPQAVKQALREGAG